MVGDLAHEARLDRRHAEPDYVELVDLLDVVAVLGAETEQRWRDVRAALITHEPGDVF